MVSMKKRKDKLFNALLKETFTDIEEKTVGNTGYIFISRKLRGYPVSVMIFDKEPK